MGNRLENFKTTVFYVILFVSAIEYFKYWCARNYDRIHCTTSTSIYTQNSDKFSRVIQIVSKGTSACDKEAQVSTINRRIMKIFKNYKKPQVYCINKNLDSLAGDVVGFTTTIEDKDKLTGLCEDELLVLGESLL